MKKFFWISTIFLIACSGYAAEGLISLYGNFRHDLIVKNYGLNTGLIFDYTLDEYRVFWDWQLKNYQAGDFEINFPILQDLFNSDGGVYYYLNEGFFSLNQEALTARIGYFHIQEGEGRKYPLWISPNADGFPAVQIQWSPLDWFTFKNDLLFMRTGMTDWATTGNLQNAKTLYYRRATLRPFSFWEFGYEEAVLFLGRSLDWPYLLSLFPYQMMQEMRNNFTAPWKENFNDNGMQGLYTKFYFDPVIIYGSIFVDDFNVSNFKAANNKLAWNLGLEYKISPTLTGFFETAGATKYAYQRWSLSVPPYAYVRYEDEPHLPVEYNMLGYKYGPNNAVFNFELCYAIPSLTLTGSYELLIFGHRGPLDQWDEPGGTMPVLTSLPWLNDPVLQIENTIGVTFDWEFYENAKTFGSIGLTFVSNNELEKGKSDIRFSFDLGAQYTFILPWK